MMFLVGMGHVNETVLGKKHGMENVGNVMDLKRHVFSNVECSKFLKLLHIIICILKNLLCAQPVNAATPTCSTLCPSARAASSIKFPLRLNPTTWSDVQ